MQRRPLFIVLVVIAGSVRANEPAFPGSRWITATPDEVGLDAAKLAQARDYALQGEGSGFITRHGRLVMSWGDARKRYDLKSSSKSIGVTALGLAIADGKIRLSDEAAQHHPGFGVPPESNARTGWLDEITILQLATQTAGFEKPGGYQPLLFRPGTKWHYSDGGPNWLAECVALVYQQDVESLLFERVFTPLGISAADLRWRNNAYRPHQINNVRRCEFGSGVHANVDAMARIGYLYLRRGNWRGEQLIPAEFVDQVRTTVPQVVGLHEHAAQYGNASDHYGLLWWNNADRALPTISASAYWSWGLYDSLIVVFPDQDIVAARAGKSWKRDDEAAHYDVLQPFFQPIVDAVVPERTNEEEHEATKSIPIRHQPDAEAPYPPSPVISGIRWAEPTEIIRRAPGSDNWPITWADDDHLYTAYGDGFGFQPHVARKLSMGFARITGGPGDFRGANVRAASGETRGDGPSGKKASGLLMVDGVLYLWARNAGNSQLAWSDDHARTWSWAGWRMKTGFGCPTLLNFGRDYAGARDDYVYIYSPDTDTAYQPADRMVLARAAKGRLRERDAYEFFDHFSVRGATLTVRDAANRTSERRM